MSAEQSHDHSHLIVSVCEDHAFHDPLYLLQ